KGKTMSTIRRAASWGTAGLVVAVAFAPGTAQVRDKGAEPQPIPLDSVYVTSEQKGSKRVATGGGDFGRKALEALRERARRVGLSNVFLVRGATIQEAVEATSVAYDVGLGGSEPISADQLKKDERVWVVAYFGLSGSSPP